MDRQPEIAVKQLPSHLYVGRYYFYNYDPHAAESDQPHVVDGLLHIVDSAGNHGVIDLDDNEFIPCAYTQIDCYDRFGVLISRPRTRHVDPEWPHRYQSYYLDHSDVGLRIADITRRNRPRFYGFINARKEEILPCACDYLKCCWQEEESRCRLLYASYGRYGVKDLAGHDIVPFEFDELWSRKVNGSWLFFAIKDGKQGLFDENGREIIAVTHYDITTLSEASYLEPRAVMAVDFSDRWKVFDVQGSVLASFTADKDDRLEAFEKARGLLDSLFEADRARRAEFDAIDFEKEEAKRGIYTTEEGHQGRRNSEGKVVIPALFNRLVAMRNGLFVACLSADNYSYDKPWRDPDYWLYDSQGELLHDEGMKAIFETSTGKIALVNHEGEAYFYDEATQGVRHKEEYFNFRYFELCYPYYLVTSREYWVGLADGDGNIVVPMEFRDIDEQITERSKVFTAKHKDDHWYAIEVKDDR